MSMLTKLKKSAQALNDIWTQPEEFTKGEEFEQYFPSLRLIDGANRLTRFALESGANDDQGWLSGFLQDNLKGLALIGSDNEAFEDFLMEATHSLVKEIKRRDAA